MKSLVTALGVNFAFEIRSLHVDLLAEYFYVDFVSLSRVVDVGGEQYY